MAIFDANGWTVYTTSNSGLPDSIISSISIDNKNSKWIGTCYGGLGIYNELGVPVRADMKTTTGEFIDVYPNPATNRIRFVIPAGMKVNQIDIFNTQGRLCKQIKTNNNTNIIDLCNLTDGVYYLRFNTNKGFIAEKVIKVGK